MEEQTISAVPESGSAPKKKKNRKKKIGNKLVSFFGRILVFLLVTVILVVGALYGVMYVLIHGPSPAARDLFVRSVNETSAIGFLANLYLPQEEIDAILAKGNEEPADYQPTNTELIQIPTTPPPEEQTGPQPDAWGYVDEDGDGIIIEEIKGEGFVGKMMIVLDPSRVIVGTNPKAFGDHGNTVAEIIENHNGVAGTNAGGFEDLNGMGNGSEPDSMVVYEGKIYYAAKGNRDGFIGIDSNSILHVGKMSEDSVKKNNIQYGVCFGPVLVSNGQPRDLSNTYSGVNPRTAIGQRSDGAMLLLVVDGRQIASLGATYTDLVDIFMSFGAVNACNLDGGSSSLMYYQGDYINNSNSVVGVRDVATAIVVLPQKEVSDNG